VVPVSKKVRNFAIDEPLFAELMSFADKSGESMSLVVREALRHHLRKAKATA
jgi:hypothetical protein